MTGIMKGDFGMKLWVILSLLISIILITLFGEVGAFMVLAIFVGFTTYMDYRNNFRPKF